MVVSSGRIDELESSAGDDGQWVVHYLEQKSCSDRYGISMIMVRDSDSSGMILFGSLDLQNP
jgi:hypothetical protein